MKTPLIGISQFFINNTPKFWQIVGDLGLLLAFVNGICLELPQVLDAAGITTFVMPAIIVKINTWCVVGGAIIKFSTKFFGKKEPKADA